VRRRPARPALHWSPVRGPPPRPDHRGSDLAGPDGPARPGPARM